MKVLIISYYFPPQTSVGAFRIARFVDHFKDMGLQTVILTVQDPDPQFHPYDGAMPEQDEYAGWPVYRVRGPRDKWSWQLPTRVIKMLARLFRHNVDDGAIASRFWRIDMESGWVRPALRAARRLVREYQPDAILVSCPPFSTGLIGARLKHSTGLPLILDYRDCWQFSPYLRNHQRKQKAVEDRILGEADVLVVTTPSDYENYQSLPGNLKVKLIHNGFDPVFNLGPSTKATRFRLLYLGAWDNAERNPRLLLEVLQESNLDWELVSFGNCNQILLEHAEAIGVQQRLCCIDAVPKVELLPYIQEAAALVILQGTPPNASINTHIAAKTLEYLATGRPILAAVAAGDNRDFLIRYGGDQVYLCQPEKKDTIAVTLNRLHDDWAAGRHTGLRVKPEFLQAFGSQEQAQQLRQLLDEACENY